MSLSDVTDAEVREILRRDLQRGLPEFNYEHVEIIKAELRKKRLQ